MLYVDPATYRQPNDHRLWCHLASNVSLDELHDFAAKLGLRRSQFRPHPAMPHYDLAINVRSQAIQRRAIAVSGNDLARKCSKIFNGPDWPPIEEQR